MDSLIESCFNSEEHSKWANYRLEVKNPMVSECSVDEHMVLKPESRLETPSRGDPFSDFHDSEASPLSKGDSSIANSQRSLFQEAIQFDRQHQIRSPTHRDSKYKSEYYQKFCFYKIFNGLKLPTLLGERDFRYSMKDIIDISISQVQLRTRQSRVKLSAKAISEILAFYQAEFGGSPLDLIKHMQVKGHLMCAEYHLSAPQLNALAASLPYMIGLRYINLHNVGMQDEQAAYILLACRGLSKLR